MCPDRQLISIYLDGELPSPWKEKMESHLEQCPHCSRLLESYRLFSASSADGAYIDSLQKAKARVWQNLEEEPWQNRYPARRPDPHHAHGGGGFWGRRVSMPLPAATAAAVLLVIAAVLWARLAREPAAAPNMTLASEESAIRLPKINDNAGFDSSDIIPVTDLNRVLQYLGSRDSGDILILRLPESRNFISSGEPAIIKAADYSGRKP